jgi:hypothetical protein
MPNPQNGQKPVLQSRMGRSDQSRRPSPAPSEVALTEKIFLQVHTMSDQTLINWAWGISIRNSPGLAISRTCITRTPGARVATTATCGENLLCGGRSHE